MTLQPITDPSTGEKIDEYDDGVPDDSGEKQGSGVNSSELPESASSTLPEETGASDAPGQQSEASAENETPESTQPPPQETSLFPVLPLEDPTDFDKSDVKIEILLWRNDGHPQGRLVTVVIHNFSGAPVVQDFREADLTTRARLDTIQKAIYPPMQRFLLDLAGRKQQKLEQEARRQATRPAPSPVQKSAPAAAKQVVSPTSDATATGPSSPQASSVPSASPAPAAFPKATSATGEKKETLSSKGKTTYEKIPLF